MVLNGQVDNLEEDELIEHIIRSNESRSVRPKGSPFFKRFWSRQTARLKADTEQLQTQIMLGAEVLGIRISDRRGFL